MTPERLYCTFGPRALDLGLFHANEPALRFELSSGATRIDEFARAFDRAREILGYLFRDSASLTVVLHRFDDGAGTARAVLRSARECGIPLLRPRCQWTEDYQDEHGAELRRFVSFRAEPASLTRLAWGALGADLGIRPALHASVTIADVERGILVHPYDDRGMDVIGPNRDLLAAAYSRFNGYLLDYDRERMRGFFDPNGP
ncbi:MAG TPA: DUF3885 domain-containing protein [Longimicrobium sp.]